jgi:hypothetical protein
MTTTAPPRSDAERAEALALANVIRTQRATLKRRVRWEEAQLSDHLADPQPWLVGAPVWQLLLAMPHVGPVRARAWLDYCDISPRKTVGGMTERQRGALVALVLAHELRVRRGHYQTLTEARRRRERRAAA